MVKEEYTAISQSIECGTLKGTGIQSGSLEKYCLELSRDHDWENLEKAAKAAHELFPQKIMLLVYLRTSLASQGKFDEALKIADELIGLDPRSLHLTLKGRAEIYLKKGRHALTTNPSNPKIVSLFNKALNDYSDSLALGGKAIADNYKGRFLAYIAIEKFSDAFADATQYFKSGEGDAHTVRGWAAFACGNKIIDQDILYLAGSRLSRDKVESCLLRAAVHLRNNETMEAVHALYEDELSNKLPLIRKMALCSLTSADTFNTFVNTRRRVLGDAVIAALIIAPEEIKPESALTAQQFIRKELPLLSGGDYSQYVDLPGIMKAGK